MINLDSLLKSRDITLPTKVCLVKAMVFPVVMYGCESWTTKKAECQRIDAFELWCWRRHLRVPWTARKSSQSILKEISPEYSLEGLMLKLKLQYFGHLMWRTDSLEKTPTLGRLKAGRGDDWGGDDVWMALPAQWIWVWASSRRWWRTGKPGVLQSWDLKESGTTEWLNNKQGLNEWTQSGIGTSLEVNLNSCVYIKVSAAWIHWLSSLWMAAPWGTCGELSPSYPHTTSRTLWIMDEKVCVQTVCHRNKLLLIIEQGIKGKKTDSGLFL